MELVIGTAQFGLNYGIANDFKIVGISEIKKILHSAFDKGVGYLETAKAYGNAEEILGSIGINKWKVINKVPKFDIDYGSPRKWLINNFLDSIHKLNVENFDTLLFHNVDDILQNYGEELFNEAIKLKNKGYFKKIGVSLYDPNELKEIHKLYNFDSYQFPCNIFDHRFISSGWINKLNQDKKEIQIRSIFLQGMILKNQFQLPNKFKKWHRVWFHYAEWLKKNNITTMDACISFIKNQRNINKILIGVNNENQFKLIFNKFNLEYKNFEYINFINDEKLLNPTKW